MTRDEHRAKCVGTIALALAIAMFPERDLQTLDELGEKLKRRYLIAGADGFDSLHGIAWVVPVEDVADWDEEKSQPGWNWRRMSASRDLTNAPEKNL